MLKTRWPQRQSLDFKTTKFADKHLANVERKVPDLAEKLEAARAQWQRSFWDGAGLPTQKADSEVALTADEIAVVRQAIKDLKPDPYTDALYTDLEELVETGFTDAKSLLHIEADLKNVKPTMAMDALRKNVDKFTFMVNEREQAYMNQLVDTALSEGWTPKRLASEIGDAFSDGYHVADGVTVPTDAWSQMVARTELARAQVMGQIALYKTTDVKKVRYVTTEGQNVCDDCAEDDDQIFDIDDAPELPQHPNCCCAYMAADADVDYQEAA